MCRILPSLLKRCHLRTMCSVCTFRKSNSHCGASLTRVSSINRSPVKSLGVERCFWLAVLWRVVWLAGLASPVGGFHILGACRTQQAAGQRHCQQQKHDGLHLRQSKAAGVVDVSECRLKGVTMSRTVGMARVQPLPTCTVPCSTGAAAHAGQMPRSTSQLRLL